MFKYQMNHPKNFIDREHKQSTYIPCLLIFSMQFSATIFTEIINLFLIFEAKDAKEALMNFVALEVISQIDDIYYIALQGEDLKDSVKNDCPEITNTTRSMRKKYQKKSQQEMMNQNNQLSLNGSVSEPLNPPANDLENNNFKYSWGAWFERKLYKTLKFFYASYYYFFPMIVPAFAFCSAYQVQQ